MAHSARGVKTPPTDPSRLVSLSATLVPAPVTCSLPDLVHQEPPPTTATDSHCRLPTLPVHPAGGSATDVLRTRVRRRPAHVVRRQDCLGESQARRDPVVVRHQEPDRGDQALSQREQPLAGSDRLTGEMAGPVLQITQTAVDELRRTAR